MHSVLRPSPPIRYQIKQIIKKLDKDNNGEIGRDEFVEFIRGVKMGKSLNRARGCILGMSKWWSSGRTKTIKVVIIGYLQVIGTMRANFPKTIGAATTTTSTLTTVDENTGEVLVPAYNYTTMLAEEETGWAASLNTARDRVNTVLGQTNLPPG